MPNVRVYSQLTRHGAQDRGEYRQAAGVAASKVIRACRFRCPLLGVKRTFVQLTSMSAFDPKRTSRLHQSPLQRQFLQLGECSIGYAGTLCFWQIDKAIRPTVHEHDGDLLCPAIFAGVLFWG